MMATASRARRGLVSACSWTVLAAACPTGAHATEAAAEQSAGHVGEDRIVVIGTRYISGIQPERDLDEEAISSYGTSTIDDLLSEVQAELGEDREPPLILVNGERVNSLEDIGGLPVEALRDVKVLPHGSAVAAGGTSTQRLVSLTLKPKVRSATALFAHKLSTDGDWNAERGEALLTSVDGPTRMNLTFKMRDESSLLESERDIIQPDPAVPFAQGGNVVGFPGTSAEIDPLLSALAGQIVTVAPIPGVPNPTLADFAAGANDPALIDLGRFRTLRPDFRTYGVNGSFWTRLAPWLTGNATLNFNRSNRLSARGLPAALFVLPAANPSSPFSSDVGLAFYGPDPLNSRSRQEAGGASLTLNGEFGRWTSHFNARHARSKHVTTVEREGLPAIPLGLGADPFAGDVFALAPIQTNKATARNITNSALLSFAGPAVELPAGDLLATVEGEFGDDRLRSTSNFSGLPEKRSFHRRFWSLRGAIEAPLLSGAPVGELGATAEASLNHASDAGMLHEYTLGLTWEPLPVLRFRGEFERTEDPVSASTLGDPVVVTSRVRVFDPLTGETVDVRQITGGNPDLKPEENRLWRLSGQWLLIQRKNLRFNAEYTDSEERNFVSLLPEASAAVMLAFPDRFIRNPEGVLRTIDLRPVNFDSHRQRRLRYGLSLSTNIAGGGAARVQAAPPTESGDENPLAEPAATRALGRRPVRLQLNANHSIVLQDEILIRPGIASVDLLEGGAIGIAGGRVRHQFDATAALSSSGVGVRLGVSWRGKHTLDSRIGGVIDTLRFSPVLAVNFRAFADLRRFLPDEQWARGLRLSFNLLNATNDRQEVRDSAGNRPLQYQPGYRDPIGRSIEFEIRKVF